jgi:hypothetical protein
MQNKKVDFVESKFHLNEYIEWHCMPFELNWNDIPKLDSTTLNGVLIQFFKMKCKLA